VHLGVFEVPGRILEDFLAGPVGTFEIVAEVPEGSGIAGSGPDGMVVAEESKGETVEAADGIEADSGGPAVGSKGTGVTAGSAAADSEVSPVRLVSSWVSVRVVPNLVE
jgi:hypothetical protein